MATIAEFRFPTGRLHTTPWGRHVNEGATEWPPAPWRLLRALIATWHLKLRDTIPESTLRSLIHHLAAQPPEFSLPRASQGHTRHYMPVIEGKNTKSTKIFDTFLVIAPTHSLRVRWTITLPADQRAALASLLENLGYLGRAESLVEAQLDPSNAEFFVDARALANDEALPNGGELVRLLTPLSDNGYQTWRASRRLASTPVPSTTPAKAKGTAKRVKPAKSKAPPDLPIDVFAALHADTGNLQSAGWALPPGAETVDYVRPTDCFDVSTARAPRRSHAQGKLAVARFSVASQVLPRLTRAVSVAERIHQTLVKISNNAPIFTGLDASGLPGIGHGHAYIWCEAQGARDAVTHVTIFARDGFDESARLVLRQLQRVWGYGGHDLQLVLLGFGTTGTLADASPFAARPARVWRSLTPFIPTRHPKTYRDGRPKLDKAGWPIGSAEHDLRRLLASENHALPVKIERLSHAPLHGRNVRWLEFQTERQHGDGRRAHQAPIGFKLTFAEPISGPLALGYGAHFGLGLFVPVEV